MRAANEPMSATVHMLPEVDYRGVFRIRRAGCEIVDETVRTNAFRQKRPHHKRQFGHGAMPGGPDGGNAA